MTLECFNNSVAEYLQDVRATADALAMAGSPVSEKDLIMHTLKGVGDEFDSVAAAVRVRDTPITFDELFDKLEDFERRLKRSETMNSSVSLPTANYTTRQSNQNRSYTKHNHNSSRSNWHNQSSGNYRSNNSLSNQNLSSNGLFCNYCEIPGHSTNECRKLPRFLESNIMQISNAQPVANMAFHEKPSNQHWLVDSGALHRVTGDVNNLQHFSAYGGPDEINISDGTGLKISHIGNSTLVHNNNSLVLDGVLCSPYIRNNLLSVSKFIKSNNVSLEFFPMYFLVKDIRTGVPMLRGKNINDVYYLPRSINPQVNHTMVSQLDEWHQCLGHPTVAIIRSISKSSDLNVSLDSVSKFHCNSCNSNKSRKLPFAENSLHSSKPLELIYSDVWGPTDLSIDGFRYYLIFVDHFSK